MFLGTYLAHLIGKNRSVLPKKFRIHLKGENELVLTKGLDKCIWGFSMDGWSLEMEKYLKMPIEEEESRNKRRFIFGEAEIVKLDRQGRFVIPDGLLKFAEVRNDLILIGIGDRFEIWGNKNWKSRTGKVKNR